MDVPTFGFGAVNPSACRRARCARRVALALAGPPLLWGLLVALAPTDCARRAIESRLSAASGRTARLGGVRLGFLGGVYLHDLRVGAPDSGDDPWLRLDLVRIDVSPWALLLGRVEPTELDVRGANVRVRRRADGTFELADFLQRPAEPRAEDSDHGRTETAVALHVRGATLVLVDEPTATELTLSDVEGRATCNGVVSCVRELWGRVNGGTFALAAQVDRSGETPAFEGQLRTRGVAVADRMGVLSYLVPVLRGTSDGFDGSLDLDLYLRGEGTTREALRDSVVGHGRFVLDPVRLDGSRLLDGVARVVDLPPSRRVGSARADFTVREGRVGSENFTLDVARVPLVLTGWTDVDGRLDYRLRGDRLAEKLPAPAREFLEELDVDLAEVADVRLSGTADALSVAVNGVPLADGGPNADPARDRERLMEIGRRVRDRIRR